MKKYKTTLTNKTNGDYIKTEIVREYILEFEKKMFNRLYNNKENELFNDFRDIFGDWTNK